MKCRSCGSENVHRSRLRESREKIITVLTNRRYYRCHDCNARTLLRKPPEPKAPVVSARRRMRVIVKWAKIIGVILALIGGLYIVTAPFLDLPRPVPRQQR